MNKSKRFNTITTKNGKFALLKPIIPPIHITIKYYHLLIQLIDEMIKSYMDLIDSLYSDPSFIQDSINYKGLKYFKKDMLFLVDRWNKEFSKKSKFIASLISKSVESHVDRITKGLKKELKENNWHVSFSELSEQALISREAVIMQNVALIKNISSDMQKNIAKDLINAITRGKSKKDLTNVLSQYQNVSKSRAKLIANDQINKATSVIALGKQKDLGLQYSIWKHSFGDKKPRKSHLEANNRVFEISKGCLIDGEYIYPAEKINCTCYSIMALKINE